MKGDAALQAVEQGIPADADETMDLLPEGRMQALRLQRVLGEFTINGCLRSRTRRSLTTAQLGLARQALDDISVMDQLRERSRGIFSYAPDDWAKNHPLYKINKNSTLDWQPHGIDYNGNQGESLRQVRDTRVEPVLAIADEIAPGGTVALATHAEWMLALRAYMLHLDDESFQQPLIVNPPAGMRALEHSKWIGHGQVDIYMTPNLTDPDRWQMGRFRSISTDPTFDTGWIEISHLSD